MLSFVLTKTSALIKIPEISSNTVDPDEKVHNEHNASVRLLFLDVIAFRALCPWEEISSVSNDGKEADAIKNNK